MNSLQKKYFSAYQTSKANLMLASDYGFGNTIS